MRNHAFFILVLFISWFQTATSSPLKQSATLKTRRFEISPLFGTSNSDLLSSLTTSAAVSSISFSAGGISHRKSLSTTSSSSTQADGAYSIIGTLPPLPSPSSSSLLPFILSSSSSPTSSTSDPVPTSSSTSNSHSVFSLSSHEEKEWKVIGIGLIVIASIGSMILLTVFFESWWEFLLDLCGRKRKEGIEVMVPDSAERTWQFKLSAEDGHRYPSASSMDSITCPTSGEKSKSPYPCPITPKPLFQPPSYFRPSNDPHPLEPLFRRPSTRTPIIKSPSILPYS